MSNRTTVERLLAGMATGASADMADLYAEDAVVELPFATPGGLRLDGRAAIREHFRRAGASPLRLRPTRLRLHETLDPAVIVAEYDYEGEVTTTGTTFVVANVQIITVRDGLIFASRDFHDHAAIAAALA
jgi:ketosteroid isomerase-like protein